MDNDSNFNLDNISVNIDQSGDNNDFIIANLLNDIIDSIVASNPQTREESQDSNVREIHAVQNVEEVSVEDAECLQGVFSIGSTECAEVIQEDEVSNIERLVPSILNEGVVNMIREETEYLDVIDSESTEEAELPNDFALHVEEDVLTESINESNERVENEDSPNSDRTDSTEDNVFIATDEQTYELAIQSLADLERRATLSKAELETYIRNHYNAICPKLRKMLNIAIKNGAIRREEDSVRRLVVYRSCSTSTTQREEESDNKGQESVDLCIHRSEGNTTINYSRRTRVQNEDKRRVLSVLRDLRPKGATSNTILTLVNKEANLDLRRVENILEELSNDDIVEVVKRNRYLVYKLK